MPKSQKKRSKLANLGQHRHILDSTDRHRAGLKTASLKAINKTLMPIGLENEEDFKKLSNSLKQGKPDVLIDELSFGLMKSKEILMKKPTFLNVSRYFYQVNSVLKLFFPSGVPVVEKKDNKFQRIIEMINENSEKGVKLECNESIQESEEGITATKEVKISKTDEETQKEL